MGWNLAASSSTGLPSPAPSAANITSTVATISCPPITSAIAYNFFYTPLSGSEVSAGSSVSPTLSLTGLNPQTSYSAKIIATIMSQTTGLVSFVTVSAAAVTFHQTNIMQGMYGNGMLNPASATPVEGAISGVGRTYIGSISPFSNPYISGVGRPRKIIYGIRFLLCNLNTNPISGAKMVVSVAHGQTNDGYFVPDGGNVSATNPLSGWAKVTISGNPNLPVVASTSSMMGANWTDWLMFPGGVGFGQRFETSGNANFIWRFLHPGQSSATNYALTFSSWGVNDYERNGTLTGIYRIYQFEMQTNVNQFFYKYYHYDGDAVSNPALVNFANFSANESPTALLKYGPPGPGAHPFINVQFLTDIGGE